MGSQEKFPVIASILSPEALIERTLSGYAIGEVFQCRYFSGGFNHTYQVITHAGKTYYLRVYRKPWRTFADIGYELDAIRHLAQKEVRAAQPVANLEGDLINVLDAPEGTRYAVLFEEASGDVITYDDMPKETARSYGRTVAQMHTAMEDFSSPHKRFHKDLVHLIDCSLGFTAPYMTSFPEDWTYLQHFCQRLRDKFAALPLESLEWGFCHGDLQGYHAYGSIETGWTLIDFDCCGWGYTAFDLGVYLWCCRLEDSVDIKWAPYLESYLETRTLAAVDIKAIPLFACARYVWHIGVHTQNATDWGFEKFGKAYFDQRIKMLKDAERDYLSN